jgi:hypothetical protein
VRDLHAVEGDASASPRGAQHGRRLAPRRSMRSRSGARSAAGRVRRQPSFVIQKCSRCGVHPCRRAKCATGSPLWSRSLSTRRALRALRGAPFSPSASDVFSLLCSCIGHLRRGHPASSLTHTGRWGILGGYALSSRVGH